MKLCPDKLYSYTKFLMVGLFAGTTLAFGVWVFDGVTRHLIAIPALVLYASLTWFIWLVSTEEAKRKQDHTVYDWSSTMFSFGYTTPFAFLAISIVNHQVGRYAFWIFVAAIYAEIAMIILNEYLRMRREDARQILSPRPVHKLIEIGYQCLGCNQFDWCSSGRKEAVARGEKANPDARCMFCSEEW